MSKIFKQLNLRVTYFHFFSKILCKLPSLRIVSLAALTHEAVMSGFSRHEAQNWAGRLAATGQQPGNRFPPSLRRQLTASPGFHRGAAPFR